MTSVASRSGFSSPGAYLPTEQQSLRQPSDDLSGPGLPLQVSITGESVEYGADTIKQKEVLASLGTELEMAQGSR